MKPGRNKIGDRGHDAHPHRGSLPRTGLARVLSKLGFCSRTQAQALIEAGRVRLNGAVQRDPEKGVSWARDRVEVDGRTICAEPKVYLMLNKPRGLVTTTSDEHGRDTVFRCLAESGTPGPNLETAPAPDAAIGTPRCRPCVFPVGRLDKASEGLLLFTNDTAWAARITDPQARRDKVYHVQIDRLADETLLGRIRAGVKEDGDLLAAKQASVLRRGDRTCWLEIVLDEGKNRHIRRMLAALGVGVHRLVRVAIGSLRLGTLPKGKWRALVPEEIAALTARTSPRNPAGCSLSLGRGSARPPH